MGSAADPEGEGWGHPVGSEAADSAASAAKPAAEEKAPAAVAAAADSAVAAKAHREQSAAAAVPAAATEARPAEAAKARPAEAAQARPAAAEQARPAAGGAGASGGGGAGASGGGGAGAPWRRRSWRVRRRRARRGRRRRARRIRRLRARRLPRRRLLRLRRRRRRRGHGCRFGRRARVPLLDFDVAHDPSDQEQRIGELLERVDDVGVAEARARVHVGDECATRLGVVRVERCGLPEEHAAAQVPQTSGVVDAGTRRRRSRHRRGRELDGRGRFRRLHYRRFLASRAVDDPRYPLDALAARPRRDRRLPRQVGRHPLEPALPVLVLVRATVAAPLGRGAVHERVARLESLARRAARLRGVP